MCLGIDRLKCISDHGVDMVIMSTRGLTGVARWSFGSVAEKVIRRSPAPTLVILLVTLLYNVEQEQSLKELKNDKLPKVDIS